MQQQQVKVKSNPRPTEVLNKSPNLKIWKFANKRTYRADDERDEEVAHDDRPVAMEVRRQDEVEAKEKGLEESHLQQLGLGEVALDVTHLAHIPGCRKRNNEGICKFRTKLV